MEPIVIGPTPPGPVVNVIYEITLASGIIATDPSAFVRPSLERFVSPVVTADGRVLVEPSGKASH